ncbi:hypothetical protein [Persephonella sp. KM09-Lau-8]|uniref:hypothetical protein n=1 Tax=Persephonella sp. KM09-Lau-8 TaxID=1158345 RepID=UPI000497F02B|nr:hypothetical protein [Persephonella sp. KM09-Lau-8]
MNQTIKHLIEELISTQEALNIEINKGNQGPITLENDCEFHTNWARYDSTKNINNEYFMRFYYQNKKAIYQDEFLNINNLTIRILPERPIKIIIDYEIEKNLSTNEYNGLITIQVFNEDTGKILPLVLYIDQQETLDKIYGIIEHFKNTTDVEDEGYLYTDDLIEILIKELKNYKIDLEIFG